MLVQYGTVMYNDGLGRVILPLAQAWSDAEWRYYSYRIAWPREDEPQASRRQAAGK